MKHVLQIGWLVLFVFTGCNQGQNMDRPPDKGTVTRMQKGKEMPDKVKKSEEEWKKTLSPEQYHILRQKGTERPFSGQYNSFKQKGVFKCAGCGNELFSSDTKYDSGSGWPSFWSPIDENHVVEKVDTSLFMVRKEVLCNRCGGHLGHVFDDGPAPTGLRYCINSAALTFDEEKEKTKRED